MRSVSKEKRSAASRAWTTIFSQFFLKVSRVGLLQWPVAFTGPIRIAGASGTRAEVPRVQAEKKRGGKKRFFHTFHDAFRR